jgi:PAS domain S-box-containing protein
MNRRFPSLRRNVLAAIFIAVGAVMLAGLVAIFFIGRAAIEADGSVLSQHIIVGELKDGLSTVKDAETGQRGYLLTGDEKYLEPYEQALVRIHEEVETLHARALAGELSHGDMSRLQKLIDQKLMELKETITIRRTKGLPAALEVVNTDAGQRTMEAIRLQIAQMIAEQESILGRAHNKAVNLVYYRSLIIALSTVLNLAVLLWSYRLISGESAARERAALEVLRQKELLDVTLASIGDAVMVTDVDGRITFLNQAAEKLTAWSHREAVGKPAATVFNIINESSRQRVENPVDKVLQLGVVAALANHTVLIRKDGGEVPIDDSAAPIQEPGGSTRGVVLIFRDFSERKAAEKKLIEANFALDAANRAKDHFLAALSHELRTPLTPVLAILTNWEMSDRFSGPLLADVQMLRRNVELEARLIDDLLDLNRIVAGKMSLNLELVDVHELVRSVLTILDRQINERQLKVFTRLNAARHYVKGDPARLQQVFSNILSNAIKFTDREGNVSVRSEDYTQGRLILKFKDHGIGMTPEIMSRLFKPFEQGVEVSKYGGMGLGMAISKALVDAHAGTITAESGGAGQGTEFTVVLPSIAASALKLPTAKDPQIVARQNPQEISILLVEDHEDSAEVMSRLLRERGYSVQTVGTVGDALKILDEREFSLLISDIGLPDGSGIDLIRQVRNVSAIPAIALTGFGMERDLERYRESGFDAELTKPVNFTRLEMTINQFFGARGG